MTESSGIFTFPSTGIYLVRYIMFQDSNDGTVRGYGGGAIFVTVNDSAYAAVANAYGSTPAIVGTSRMSNVCESLIDVTDVANVKVRFQTEMQNSAMKTFGSSTANKTTMTFLRLGDT